MKTIVLGLGNLIRGDDAVGLLCTDSLSEKFKDFCDISVLSLHTAGITLVDSLSGFDRAIIVDAVKTASGTPGEVFWASIDDLPDPRSDRSYHDIHLAEAIAIGRRMKLKMPEEIRILAIEVEDYDSWNEGLSQAASRGLQKASLELENYLTGN
jgi:hydrogenase maturation protease